MKSKSLVSIDQCSKEDILRILDNARKFEENPNRKLLEGKVAATLFFEPSTRTRLSFESAMLALGGSVLGFSEAQARAEAARCLDCGEPVGRPCDRFLRRFHD